MNLNASRIHAGLHVLYVDINIYKTKVMLTILIRIIKILDSDYSLEWTTVYISYRVIHSNLLMNI